MPRLGDLIKNLPGLICSAKRGLFPWSDGGGACPHRTVFRFCFRSSLSCLSFIYHSPWKMLTESCPWYILQDQFVVNVETRYLGPLWLHKPYYITPDIVQKKTLFGTLGSTSKKTGRKLFSYASFARNAQVGLLGSGNACSRCVYYGPSSASRTKVALPSDTPDVIMTLVRYFCGLPGLARKARKH